MTNDKSAVALGLWVRERASRAELSEATRAWLATNPGGGERPPAAVLGDLVIALASPDAVRTIDSGGLDEMAEGVDDAMLRALGRVSDGISGRFFGSDRIDRDVLDSDRGD